MPRHTLGDLQHAIMAVLWERGEASAAEVHEALRKARGLALTTIATMLRKMEDKGVVAHRASGRQFLYRTTVSEDRVRRSMVGGRRARRDSGITRRPNVLGSRHRCRQSQVTAARTWSSE